MRWEWDIKIKVGKWALLRKADDCWKKGQTRWAIGKNTDNSWSKWKDLL